MSEVKTLVALLALNEAANIGRVVHRVQQAVPWADVLVIDDGSVDATGDCARSAGAQVLQMPYNVGIGAAEQAAFRYAQRMSYDVMIRNDGDGQHEADDIPGLLATLHEKRVDVVIGSRFLGAAAPVVGRAPGYRTPTSRRAGIFIITGLLRILTRQPVTDPTSGFRAFNRRAIACFAAQYPQDYPEPEVIIMMHRLGLRWTEAPAHFHERLHGRSQFLSMRRAFYYMVKVVMAILIDTLRRRPQPEEAPTQISTHRSRSDRSRSDRLR